MVDGGLVDFGNARHRLRLRDGFMYLSLLSKQSAIGVTPCLSHSHRMYALGSETRAQESPLTSFLRSFFLFLNDNVLSPLLN